MGKCNGFTIPQPNLSIFICLFIFHLKKSGTFQKLGVIGWATQPRKFLTEVRSWQPKKSPWFQKFLFHVLKFTPAISPSTLQLDISLSSLNSQLSIFFISSFLQSKHRTKTPWTDWWLKKKKQWFHGLRAHHHHLLPQPSLLTRGRACTRWVRLHSSRRPSTWWKTLPLIQWFHGVKLATASLFGITISSLLLFFPNTSSTVTSPASFDSLIHM